MTTAQHEVKWVIPVDTEPEIDWDCPCLEGVPCKAEVKEWYTCDRESRRKAPGDDRKSCDAALGVMSRCVQEDTIRKKAAAKKDE